MNKVKKNPFFYRLSRSHYVYWFRSLYPTIDIDEHHRILTYGRKK
jgi:hypothetical protein